MMNGKSLSLRAVVALVLLTVLSGLSGCASEPETNKQAPAASSGTPIAQAPAGQAAPASDIQSLQRDQKQDAKVIEDANKALGVMHR